MTKMQYRRLLIVLTVPLLIAGAIFTRAVIRPNNYATILCDNTSILGENCRTTDGLGKQWDERLRGEHPAWFDVRTRAHEDNSFPYAIVSGSQRYITDARIVSVAPYMGTDESAGSPLDQLRDMTGQEISIIFGVNERDARPLNPIGCNELDFDGKSDIYTAGLCGIPNGVARVKFTAGVNSSEMLDELRTEIEREVSRQRKNIIADYAVGVPLFLALFLLGSLLIWIVKKAISYVRAG